MLSKYPYPMLMKFGCGDHTTSLSLLDITGYIIIFYSDKVYSILFAVYGERCKLYRYDKDLKEWKERGVGELKLLFHPEKLTYRLLMRREQVI
jgi:Ran GTPase-activating protein (Ran-binding protein)